MLRILEDGTIFDTAKRRTNEMGTKPKYRLSEDGRISIGPRRSEKRTAKKPNRLALGASLERLEPRELLYAVSGNVLPHPELVTVSFMPDGTDIGGSPSALFGTMNTKWTATTWQKEILKGLQDWAANSNLNFSVVSDDASAFGSCGGSGSDCNVQGDANFGDIRVGAIDLTSYLGVGMFPPPSNADTTAADFILNTKTTWNIGSSYDIHTVAAHETGHAIGMSHSTTSTAMMYSAYTSVKSALTSDDKSGIQKIYGVRTADAYDKVASNGSMSTPTNITTSIDSNKQITLTGLDITTTSDIDYYKFTIPSGSASSMTIKMQSSGISLLAPTLKLYDSSKKLISGKSITGGYNSTVQLTQPISAGQVYYIYADGADSTVFGTGAYALQVNMGTGSLTTVSSTNTATACYGAGGTSAYLDSGSDTAGNSGITPHGFERLLDLVNKGQGDFFGTTPHEHAGADEHDVEYSPDGGVEFTIVAPPHIRSDRSESDSSPGANERTHQLSISTDDQVLNQRSFGRLGLARIASLASASETARNYLPETRSESCDDVLEHNPVDVVRPKFDLVCDLVEQFA